MVLAFRWLLRLFTGLVVLGLVALMLAYWILSRSLPDYNEDFTLSGLSQPVEIVRNNNDVPHIFAKTEADAFYALGFVHAQDRLWQMTMLRRTAQGRLSEIYGGRSSSLGNLRLLRRVFTALLGAGAMALADDLVGSFASGGVLGRLSRRFGEGVVNGALTARVGLAAMETCRPLPFAALDKPGTTATTSRALAGFLARAKAEEPR